MTERDRDFQAWLPAILVNGKAMWPPTHSDSNPLCPAS